MGNTNAQTVRVLLVDDDEDEYLLTRPLVEDITHLNLNLSWVADREAMLAHFSQEQVDIVLMDYRLGNDNGIDLIQELTAAGSEIPIVLLTGSGTRSIDLAAMESGAVDYLDKDGLTSTHLERSIRYAIERARSHKREREANRLYRSLIEHTPAAFFISDANDYASKSYVSPQMESMLDKNADDSTGIDDVISWLDRVHEDDRTAVQEQIRQFDDTGSHAAISYRLLKGDGSEIWVHEEAVLVRTLSGEPVHWHGVIYDITSQKQIEATLQEHEQALLLSNQALERSNRALQEFAHVASHDLKAPLVSIMGIATMLRTDYSGVLEGEGLTHLDRIIANAGKLRQLLEEILELSRVGQGGSESSQVDLNGVITDVTNQLRYQLDERSAIVTIDGLLPTVLFNRVHLQRVFANLIDNAVQYTPPSRTPHIVISARSKDAAWEVVVRDNGCGIPAELREQAFVMLRRLPAANALNPGGTGMGLAIVSRIIELNGGRCWIDASDDAGTTMCMTIPKLVA